MTEGSDREKPKVKHELEIAYGSTYGLEEAAALLEVLRANAPSPRPRPA